MGQMTVEQWYGTIKTGLTKKLTENKEALPAGFNQQRFILNCITVIQDMMKQGLVDIGLLMEPVDTSEFEYIRLPEADSWIVTMKPDDPMAKNEVITKEDLLDKPLILPSRLNIQSELANWFGKDFEKLNVAFVANLATNAAVMVKNRLAYPVTIEGAMKFWREDLLVNRKLYPELISYSVLAWRRNIPYSTAARKFIEEINAFQA